ncbi:T9SS type A sorting domain-containing protein [Rhodocytophaga aerolata]|uniref:T9SS type A sorting domain-containing protein n=1 Tax=Rhodocytophaga aerolata TaxID=455078 RepID=A0ABT8REK6_9BACT|nr:T9SS type A sorting domain-containing protein [Rhodocytophaga aerolata]
MRRRVFYKTIPLLIFFAAFFINPLRAQTFRFEFQSTIPLMVEADTLANPWSGGMNAVHYSKMHLNEDAIEDLVVFERFTNTVSTFLALQEKGKYFYQHNLSYEAQFPKDLQGWVLLADYNGDGKKDIFTAGKLGVKVYQNVSTASSLAWKLLADPLETQGTSGMINLQTYFSDIPAIIDLDQDGDLDILTYDALGKRVEYHQNQSMERYGHADSLVFKRVNSCWGRFEQGVSCGEYVFDIDCGSAIGRAKSSLRIKHAGGYSLLALDLDGDGDKDLLTSHEECSSISKLTNHGDARQARFMEAQDMYPASKPIFFPQFPIVFYEDVDFDGLNDLVATPNVSANPYDLINFTQSSLFYKNTGSNTSPQFEFVQNNFLQATMLDVGENAFPALADYDGDGDLDLFIGNKGNPVSNTWQISATIALYENIGTPQQAAYKFITDDYLELSSLELTYIKPYFVDINGDQVTDLTFTRNRDRTDVQYILNTAPEKGAFQFSKDAVHTLPLPLNADDTPLLYDLDGDGDVDALISKSSGELVYYLNTGSAVSPQYILQSNTIEKATGEAFEPHLILSIADFDGNGKADLMAADKQGKLTMYPDLEDNFDRSPIKLESREVTFQKGNVEYISSPFKGFLFPTAADLDGDNLPEILLGTQTGGVVLLQNQANSAIPNGLEEREEPYLVYPNPSRGDIQITFPENGQLTIHSLLGQQVMAKHQLLANQELVISLRHLPNGFYLVQVSSEKAAMVKKILLYR